MCGLVTLVLGSGRTVAPRLLHSMTDALAHRGPDGFGYAAVEPDRGTVRQWTETSPEGEIGGILFGHRRLSIIDLTRCGHQPMASDDQDLVLAYNGEIYNFVELRAELEQIGHHFRSRSDTEVLLKAYAEWGTAAFNRFNGMFALTLWDNRRKTLVAARDRFGIKPLYVAQVDGDWLFASEIKALLQFPGAHRGLNDEKVVAYLSQCLIDDDRETLFAGVQSVEPGTFVEVTRSGSRSRPFWSLPETRAQTDPRKPDREYIEEFRSLLTDSVRLRVRSDVPIGTMLSGGLDSTAITALIHERRQAGAQTSFEGLRDFHHTFSACWPGWVSDEEADVDLLCSRLGLEAHKLYPTAELLQAVLPQASYFLDQPFETPTALIKFLLMRAARDSGVKVVLNGHGADEILAGYPGFFVPPYLAQLLSDRRYATFLRQARAFASDAEWTRDQVLSWLPDSRLSRMARMFTTGAVRSRSDVYPPLFPGQAQAAGAELLGGGASMLSQALWLKLTRHILPMWLRAEDRMSMASSVESRLPFLDYRLVEFAFRLPDDLKLRDGYSKYILRQAMRGKVPESIVDNRVKRRFASPFPQWFRGAWRPMVEQLLVTEAPVLSRFLDWAALRTRVQGYLAGDDSALDPQQLWRLLSFRLWLDQWEHLPKAPTVSPIPLSSARPAAA